MASSDQKSYAGVRRLLALLCCVIAPGTGVAAEGQTRAQPTGDGVLLQVERLDSDQGRGFRVEFDRPLQIVSDLSGSASSRFQLRLRPVRFVADPILRNAVTWRPDADLPLKFVELETTLSQDLILNLLFSVPVRLYTEVGSGMDSLRFIVNSAAEPQPMPPPEPQPPARPGGPTAEVGGNEPEGDRIQSYAGLDGLDNKEMVGEAYRTISVGEYDRALVLLGRLREGGTPDQVRFAMEFTGVALERSGRIDLASEQYRKFLGAYPKSPEKPRVEQRLAALEGIDNIATAARRTRQQRRKRRDSDGWSSFGSLNNTYRYSRNVDDRGDSYAAISMLGVDGDISARHRSESMEWQMRFSGGHYQDMRSDGDNNSDRIRYLSLRAETRGRDYGMLLGRQRSYGAGILSRYDGATLSARSSEHTRVNLVAGFPVNTTKQDLFDTSRTLYGINVDFEELLGALDLNTFFVRQDADGMLDRQAVGSELTYVLGRNSFFGMVDYDVHFGELNAAVLNGNHLMESGTRINWALNMRKSPYLSATNALIGQGVGDIGDLQDILTDDEIDDLANDRTRDSKSASLTVSHPLGERFDISSSATWLDLSRTPASGGVPAYEATGGQYYLDLRLAGQRLLGERDLSFLGVRYNTMQTTEIWSVYANSRMPWGQHLSVNPRFRVDYRDNVNGTSQWNLAPGLQLQYQTRRHLLYLESGLIYYRTDYPDLDSRELKTYFTYLGYRVTY